jgi:hypothetical protein
MLYQLSYASTHSIFALCSPTRVTRSSARAECAAELTLA